MEPVYDCIVVGSGPSGLACASALLAAGRRVHMLDAGLTLEPEREAMLAHAKALGSLTAANAPWLSESSVATRIPRKLIYGSDFPFREASEALGLSASGMGAEPSFALGGLSNVWGAATLPFMAEDTRDWPIGVDELAPHYAACCEMLGVSGEIDDLAEWLPLYGEPRGQLRMSRQAEIMLGALTQNRERLRASGLRFGRARVAARASACTYCGLCLHGCPEKLIFSAASEVKALTRNTRFSYRGGFVVVRADEHNSTVTLVGRDRQTRALEQLAASRVFLAGGALSTSALLLRSHGAYDTKLRLRDSQYFLLPLVLFRGARNADNEALHTMAQLFLELRDPEISPYTVHLQIYTYNALMAQAMRARLGRWLEPLARWGDAHIVLIQGYLHSVHSGAIELTLRRVDGGERLDARGVVNPEARRTVNALLRKLMLLSPQLGAAPLVPLLEIAEPGRGFHIGGALPMRAAPGALETDTLGRPFGWRRLHAVDATVLPSIPATTITLPVMANAHRIAAEAAEIEP